MRETRFMSNNSSKRAINVALQIVMSSLFASGERELLNDRAAAGLSPQGRPLAQRLLLNITIYLTSHYVFTLRGEDIQPPAILENPHQKTSATEKSGRSESLGDCG